ncbi:PREDICTED: protein NLP6-like isoform X1 [Camelina sativa]|uniref:Protein NLP6-like isoform X1 n=2 Tax=Camelina sativa TaxID=90675 RepID=A0ABM0TSI9_CAMSA|nr:PREDICTED: protein NLP6-like isoform X1 [Camelina sativa]
MELDDLDLSGSWPLDQIIFSSNFKSPVIFSSSEQPFSPLWSFSEAAGDVGAGDLYVAPSRFTVLAPPPPPPPPSSETDTTTKAIIIDNHHAAPSPYSGIMPSSENNNNNPDSYCAIKAKMTQALRYFKESTGQQHLLAQVWAPVKNRGRYVLTTSGQPFVLAPNSNGLHQYRMVSLTYMFSLDGELDGDLGLPGRVFRKKLPEWTPNVQYYSSKEFSRLGHALHYNVQGTLALPVFEPSRQLCVGVVELIMTSPKINYAPEVEKVCKALEAVNLKTSEILNHETTQICNEGRQNALAEILEILTVVCETYKLPLAQTWVPCRHRSVLAFGGGFKKSCSSFDGSCMGKVCMSTSDLAVYVVDAHVWGFRDACAEHHLQKGQGVAGRAFLSGNLCFSRDVTRFCKTDYPLVHYARMFKLTSCFAVCLKSTFTGDDEYVLEFFLPPAITDRREQDFLLGSLFQTMKQHYSSLKVVSETELCENEISLEVVEASEDGMVYSKLEPIRIHHPAPISKDYLELNAPEQKLSLNSDLMANGFERFQTLEPLPEAKTVKKSERKRGKTEKTISIEVLQQYFAGSLKDAAKSLGVCPTTMKRICRQHGISRWPSRKINKVNRSLTRLKHVIDSVQGADGSLNLTSLSPRPWSHQISPTENQPPKNFPPASTSPPSYLQDVKIENRDAEDSAGSSTSRASCKVGVICETRFRLPTHNQETVRQTALDDSDSSSKNIANFWTHLSCQDTASPTTLHNKLVSIKATYREDIIRFKISPESVSIMGLKQQVAKRLKLEMAAFELKYLDDDSEWVSVSCDADLSECLDTSAAKANTLRLSVHDVTLNFGSSCESSEENMMCL